MRLYDTRAERRYVEAGDAGRFPVREGDVLIHRTFEAHRDLFAERKPHVLNLPLPARRPPKAWSG